MFRRGRDASLFAAAGLMSVGVALADAAVLAVKQGFGPLLPGDGLGLLPGFALGLEYGARGAVPFGLHRPATLMHHHVLVSAHGSISRTRHDDYSEAQAAVEAGDPIEARPWPA